MNQENQTPEIPERSLEELVARIQKNKEDWDTLYQSEKRRVLNWCNGDEDLSQTAWIKLFSNIDKYDPSRPFLAWAKTVVKNIVIDETRTQHYRKSENLPYIWKYDPEDTPDEAANRSEVSVIIEEAMFEVSKTSKKLAEFLKLFSQSYTYTEIAKIKNIPVGTVKSQIHYAKNALKKELKRRGINENPL
jgi:RNA polymerase sigma-70 factor (ECF subfamily)